MRHSSQLLDYNRQWAARVTADDPEFFDRLSRQQTPRYFWIGCADSRVPANQIVGLSPGEMFVHRNVANVVVHTDLNCLSTIQYAVDVLQVREVIVCGHYGCGGVRAAMLDKQFGLIDNWLRHVQDVAEKYYHQLETFADEDARCDRLCELNVVEQVINVCQTTVVRQAWKRGQQLVVHGWIYRLTDGVLRDLEVSFESEAELAQHESTPFVSPALRGR